MSPSTELRQPSGRRRGLPRITALAALAVPALAGCSSEQLPRLGMPSPITAQGPRVLSLWQGSWIAALAVGVLVWGLIIAACILYRKRSTELPAQTRYNLPVEILYTVVPFIIIAVLFFFTARDESRQLKLSDNPDHTVNVVGRQWSWSFNYLDAKAYEAGTPGQPPTLWLPVGESVRFELTSFDVNHSFWVIAFLFKMDVIPGRVNSFEVTPTKVGTFQGRCAELCGVDHARMLFTTKVVTPEEWQSHVDQLRAEGNTGKLPSGVTGLQAE